VEGLGNTHGKFAEKRGKIRVVFERRPNGNKKNKLAKRDNTTLPKGDTMSLKGLGKSGYKNKRRHRIPSKRKRGGGQRRKMKSSGNRTGGPEKKRGKKNKGRAWGGATGPDPKKRASGEACV